MDELCDACQLAMEIGYELPCFQAGRICLGKNTHDSGPMQAAASSPVIPKAASPVVSKNAAPSRISVSQTDPATMPERSKGSTFHQQHNTIGSRIRKIHDSHRGGFRRSPRLQSAQTIPKIMVAIPAKDRPVPGPSPLKQRDNASNSEQPAAPKVPTAPLRPGPSRPRRKPNNETTPQVTESSSAPSAVKAPSALTTPSASTATSAFTAPSAFQAPSGFTAHLQKAAVPPVQINCDCPASALRVLEDLETQNHQLQDYSGPAISQHLSESLVTCVEILGCKRCSERSEQMIFMVILVQKITKMFSRLTTRFIEGTLPIFAPEKAIPLPRLFLIQQLKLEKALGLLRTIAEEHDWKTHLAMLAPICQYSKDTMDRLRRMNGHIIIPPRFVPSNENIPIITHEK